MENQVFPSLVDNYPLPLSESLTTFRGITVVCISNENIEQYFDNGVEYLGRIENNGKQYKLRVEDRFGKFRNVKREQFKIVSEEKGA